MKTTIKTLALAAISLTLFSCDDDDSPAAVNEEEVITTVEYELVNTADSNNVVTFSSVDADGDGPNLPVLQVTGMLMANSVYTGEVEFFNDLETPSEDITIEVRDEGDEHEVFYTSSLMGISIAKTDNDANGNPLGLDTSFTTGAAGTGTMTITLRHEPAKPNDGTLSGAGGETDVQVIFDVTVN